MAALEAGIILSKMGLDVVLELKYDKFDYLKIFLSYAK
jgi:hypothetical protein